MFPSYFLIYLFLFHVYEHFAHMYVYHLGPWRPEGALDSLELKREMECLSVELEIRPRSSERAASTLSC